MKIYRSKIEADGLFVSDDDVIIKSQDNFECWYANIHYDQSLTDPNGDSFTIHDYFQYLNTHYEDL